MTPSLASCCRLVIILIDPSNKNSIKMITAEIIKVFAGEKKMLIELIITVNK